jgi:oligopeptide/dipeptide ABC transporter ATP-binding protein
MYAGKIVEYANAYTIFNNPKHPYTIGLINSVPKLSFHQDQRQNKSNDFFKPMRLQTIPGQPPNLSELAGNQCSFLPRCTKSIKECALKEPGVRNIDSEHWYSCFL